MHRDLRNRPIPWQAHPPTALAYHGVPLALDDPRSREALVDLSELGIAGRNHYARTDGLNAPYYRGFPEASPRIWGRRSVADRLLTVNERLSPYGVELYVLNGYRSLELQQALWDFFIERAKESLDHPSEADCVAFAGEYCSDPRTFDAADPRTWPTHVTGGAVDTTLAACGTTEELYMGGIFDDPAEQSHTAHFEKQLARGDGNPDRLSLSDTEALRNRRLLYWVMKEVGFANYAYEWWHFDWGTQLWVVDSARSPEPRRAWYGPARLPAT